MPGVGRWRSPQDKLRQRVRLSGVTVDRSTLKALRWKAVRARKPLGRYLEEILRPALGLAPLEAPAKTREEKEEKKVGKGKER